MTKNKQKNLTKKMVYMAIFSALAFVVTLIEFPLPGFPPFLKFDVSDVVVFVSGSFVGPLGMVGVIVIRAFLHWLFKGAETGIPVGQLAAIIASVCYALIGWLLFHKWQQKKVNMYGNLSMALISSSLLLALVMFVANYYWITPFYFALGGMPLPDNYLGYVLLYIPFNLIKGLIVTGVIVILYPKIEKAVHRI